MAVFVSKILTIVRAIMLIVLMLSQTETFAAEACHQFYAKPQTKETKRLGVKILHEKNPKLHISKAVQKVVNKYKQSTGVTLTKPSDKLNQCCINTNYMLMNIFIKRPKSKWLYGSKKRN